jgi:hypothetical protein
MDVMVTKKKQQEKKIALGFKMESIVGDTNQ